MDYSDIDALSKSLREQLEEFKIKLCNKNIELELEKMRARMAEADKQIPEFCHQCKRPLSETLATKYKGNKICMKCYESQLEVYEDLVTNIIKDQSEIGETSDRHEDQLKKHDKELSKLFNRIVKLECENLKNSDDIRNDLLHDITEMLEGKPDSDVLHHKFNLCHGYCDQKSKHGNYDRRPDIEALRFLKRTLRNGKYTMDEIEHRMRAGAYGY